MSCFVFLAIQGWSLYLTMATSYWSKQCSKWRSPAMLAKELYAASLTWCCLVTLRNIINRYILPVILTPHSNLPTTVAHIFCHSTAPTASPKTIRKEGKAFVRNSRLLAHASRSGKYQRCKASTFDFTETIIALSPLLNNCTNSAHYCQRCKGATGSQTIMQSLNYYAITLAG